MYKASIYNMRYNVILRSYFISLKQRFFSQLNTNYDNEIYIYEI